MEKKLNIGLYGFGCVGSGLYSILQSSPNLPFAIKKICVKDATKPRTLPSAMFTYDKYELIKEDTIDIIVELIDDADEAYHIVTKAIERGKPVVTANKKMIAENLAALIQLKQYHNTSLRYEAAVAGAIPIIQTIQDYNQQEKVLSIAGILNGTSNYILTKTVEQQQSYETVLHEAQLLGFAETNPSLDVDAYDPKYKLVILLAQVFGLFIKPEHILNLGISALDAIDIQLALNNNLRYKLIATAAKDKNGISAYVIPQLVNASSPFYFVNDEYNSVELKGINTGTQLLMGKGAGSLPTAFAVLSDILRINQRYCYPSNQLNDVVLNMNNELCIYLRTDDEAIAQKIFTKIEEQKQLNNHTQFIGLTTVELLLRYKKELSKSFVAVCSTDLTLGQKPTQYADKKYLTGIH
jgi:homoserine dehydrogenase